MHLPPVRNRRGNPVHRWCGPAHTKINPLFGNLHNNLGKIIDADAPVASNVEDSLSATHIFSRIAREYTGYFNQVFLSLVSKKLFDKTVCVAGLGYVGLPRAQAFAEHLLTVGYKSQSYISSWITPKL